MNNIEIQKLKEDLKKYFNYSDEQIKGIIHNDQELNELKNQINKQKNIDYKLKKKIDAVFVDKPELKRKRIFGVGVGNNIGVPKKNDRSIPDDRPMLSNPNRKPKILFISDVKGWAWWIKSEYLKKYLSDEFNIDIKHVVTPYNKIDFSKIDQQAYDFYFTYGFSYINFLNRVPKKRKATGVTAHRAERVIRPKMCLADHVHANSLMLLKELHNMGFQNAFYLPNGVDEELFKPIIPIKKDGELIVGHVGKETHLKGQREFILPAIQLVGAKSSTNLRTWQDKLPHNEMPKIYNEMDVFMVASIEDGTPNPALEAAACGRPIISNRIGNMPEFIKDGWNGFLVERKISAYVEKLKYFQNNRDELIRMGINARKTVEREWTWKIQSENYRSMFRKIFGHV